MHRGLPNSHAEALPPCSHRHGDELEGGGGGCTALAFGSSDSARRTPLPSDGLGCSVGEVERYATIGQGCDSPLCSLEFTNSSLLHMKVRMLLRCDRTSYS